MNNESIYCRSWDYFCSGCGEEIGFEEGRFCSGDDWTSHMFLAEHETKILDSEERERERVG